MHTFICTKQNEHQLQNAKGRKSETANTFVTHERKFIADLVVGFAGWRGGGRSGVIHGSKRIKLEIEKDNHRLHEVSLDSPSIYSIQISFVKSLF